MSGHKPIKNKKYTLNKKIIYLTSMCYMLNAKKLGNTLWSQFSVKLKHKFDLMEEIIRYLKLNLVQIL